MTINQGADSVEAAELLRQQVQTRPTNDEEDAQRAWSRRRTDLEGLAGVDTVLDEIDARSKELERLTAVILAAGTNPGRA